MKSFCLSSWILILLFGKQTNGSSLEEHWEIQGPEFEHTGSLTFELDFTVQNELLEEQLQYALYDGRGCKQSANALAMDNPYIHSSMTTTTTTTTTGEDDNKQIAKISFDIDPESVMESSMYTVQEGDDTHAILELCIRFGLYTGAPSNEDSVEVNFLETIVLIRASIESGFQIDQLGESEI